MSYRSPVLGHKVLFTAPPVEPLTLAEAKLHIKQDEMLDDTLISADIVIARQLLEEWSGRAFNTQTWDYFLPCFPGAGEKLELPMAPVTSVASVKYIDENGVQQTWNPAKYISDLRHVPNYIVPGYQEVWPTIRDIPNAVEVRFTAGYGANAVDIPEPLRQACRFLVAHLYENREVVVMASAPFKMPTTIEAMVNNYVVSWV